MDANESETGRYVSVHVSYLVILGMVSTLSLAISAHLLCHAPGTIEGSGIQETHVALGGTMDSTLLDTPGPFRKLQRYTNNAATADAKATTGCIEVDLTQAVTLDFTTPACNNQRCPSCIIVTKANWVKELTIYNCSKMMLNPTKRMGDSPYQQSSQTFTFVNEDRGAGVRISDGSGTWFPVRAGLTVTAVCTSGSQNKLMYQEPKPKWIFEWGDGVLGTCPLGFDPVMDLGLCRFAATTKGFYVPPGREGRKDNYRAIGCNCYAADANGKSCDFNTPAAVGVINVALPPAVPLCAMMQSAQSAPYEG